MQQENSTTSNQNQGGNQETVSSNGQETTDTSAIYLGDVALQSGTEIDKDKNSNGPKKDSVAASGFDDLQLNSGGAAGIDRAGTTERKKYGDTELNKGLESQARDEES